MQVRVRTPIRATEDPDRVVQAATAFFPGDVTIGDEVTVTCHDLEALRRRIWELRIIDTMRTALLAGIDGDVLRFRLDKQAAAVGRVALPVSHHPLGALEVKVEADDLEALVWSLCPPTKDGEIVKD